MANVNVPQGGAPRDSEVKSGAIGRLTEIQKQAYEIAAAVQAVWALLGEPQGGKQEEAANTLLVMISTHADKIADSANMVELHHV